VVQEAREELDHVGAKEKIEKYLVFQYPIFLGVKVHLLKSNNVFFNVVPNGCHGRIGLSVPQPVDSANS